MTERVVTLIRKACRPGIWSRGVDIVRASGVTLESRTEQEIVLRVRTAASTVAPSVFIYPGSEPGEEEWDCDCDGRVRPCEHIAAGAIALGQADGAAKRDGDGVPGAPAGEAPPGSPATTPAQLLARRNIAGRVVYRFTGDASGLRLQRNLTDDAGGEVPLKDRLSRLVKQPAASATLNLEQWDLRADLLLQTGAGGILAPDKVLALLAVLTDAPNVFLDDRPVTFVREPILPQASVSDRGDEVVVLVDRDPRITRVVAAGIVLCGDQLHALGSTDLSGPWLQNLPRTQIFAPHALAELKTRVLPELAKQTVLTVNSRRLPATERGLVPRIQINVDRVEGGLSALPLLVYGDPPCARVDDDKLVHLQGPVPVRDRDAEIRLRHRLREVLDLLPGRRTNVVGPDTARFVERLERFRAEVAGSAASSIERRTRLVPRFEVTPTHAPGGNAIGVELSFEVEGQPDVPAVSGQVVLDAWHEGTGLVPLGEHGFAVLPTDWLTKYGDRIADLLAARGSDGRLANHALPLAAEMCDQLAQPRPPELERLAALVTDFTAIPAARLPDDLQAELRAYQQRGVDWLSFLRRAGLGGILADDMGLGKTLQVLCTLSGRSLVVCPTSVLGNWRQEIKRFRPNLNVNVYHETGRALRTDADVTLTSYALLRLDQERLAEVAWDCVVLDEAQAIKNPDSQTARAAFALPGDFRVAMTGTPVENRLDELWSLAHFTNPGLLGGRGDFDRRFARPIAAGDDAALSALRSRLRPFLLRRLKKEVAPELPPRIETILHVALDETERTVYQAILAATRKEVVEVLNRGGGVMAALELLLRLRQAACHVDLVPGQSAASSAKVERLRDVLSEAVADGHRALVFSQWTGFLDRIEPHLEAAAIEFIRLDGTTRDRESVVKRFQSADGPPVMLMSLKAGGTGLNLTAADHVFICDPWWNPAAEMQAADRAHRIGQDRPVLIHRLVTDDTVEERLVALQETKRGLAEAAVGDGGAAKGLDREDLLALLA